MTDMWPDEPGFWDRLGVDDTGMPAHLPMGFDEHGRGPANDSEAAYFGCWCMDRNCPLSVALRNAWYAGLRGVVSASAEGMD